MENIIKKHIDSLRKKRVKTLESLEENQNAEGIEGEYGKWLIDILSMNNSDSYFPKSQKELDRFQLLSLEILYKRTFKSACDDNHPIIEELLSNLGLDKNLINECINKTKAFNREKLEYYLLFEDELLESDLALDLVVDKIDQLALDAKQGTIVSHPAKMTNPACKFPRIYVVGNRRLDGFVRTGNSTVEFDMHINATKLKIFKFFVLKYQGKTNFFYIRNGDISAFKQVFNISEDKCNNWIDSFSSCVSNQDYRTNKYVRQLYFPINEQYHLLSILQPSGLVFSLKEKIDLLNDRLPESYVGKKLRKDKKFCDTPFSSIYNLTVTKHGGDHPKNISGLNNKHQIYYLLDSTPPKIEKRSIRFPKRNFFGDSFRFSDCRDVFMALHKILSEDYNNINIREGRDYRIHELLDRIINKMWAVRSVSENQFHAVSSSLKSHQKIWLCHDCAGKREETDDWLEKLIKEITRWLIRSYEKIFGKQAIKLGKEEQLHILAIINQNKEALR